MSIPHWQMYVVTPSILTLIAAWFCFTNLNSPSIQMADENAHVRATQSILMGDWLVPQVADTYYLNKPPFKMWLTSVAVHFLGESNAAYRTIDALAGIGTVVLTYYLGIALFGSALAGVIAALTLLGSHSFLFVHGARHGVQDSLLVFLSTLSLLLFWRAYQALKKNRPWRTLVFISSCCIGLAILTKSAAGLLPLFIILSFIVASCRKCSLSRSFSIVCWSCIPAAIVSLAYFVPVFLLIPGSFDWIVGDQLVHRAVVGIEESSDYFYYLVQLFKEHAVTNSLLLACACGVVLLCYVCKRTPSILFLLIWMSLPVVLYSGISTRFTWYIAASYPAFALAVGLLAAKIATIGSHSYWRTQISRVSLIAIGICLLFRIHSTASEVLKNKERIELDTVVEDILHFDTTRDSMSTVAILRTKRHSLAQEEFPYYYMLGERTKTLRSFKSLKKFIVSHQPEFVLLPAGRMYELLPDRKVRGYTFLPARRDRTEWNGMLSYVEHPQHLQSFSSPSKTYDKKEIGLLLDDRRRSHYMLPAGLAHKRVPSYLEIVPRRGASFVDVKLNQTVLVSIERNIFHVPVSTWNTRSNRLVLDSHPKEVDLIRISFSR